LPIVHIQALPPGEDVDVRAVLSRVCVDLAAAIGCPERQVWATWTTLPEGRFVEGEVATARQPRDSHPPVVRVLAKEGRDDETIARMLETVAGSLAATLPIDPDNVFAIYEELRGGKVMWGGRVQP